MGLVVKSWAVDNAPVDELGNYVVIKCRQERTYLVCSITGRHRPCYHIDGAPGSY